MRQGDIYDIVAELTARVDRLEEVTGPSPPDKKKVLTREESGREIVFLNDPESAEHVARLQRSYLLLLDVAEAAREVHKYGQLGQGPALRDALKAVGMLKEER